MTLRGYDLVSGLIRLYFSLQLIERRFSQRALGEDGKTKECVGRGCIYAQQHENVCIYQHIE